ncbi:MAG: VOC family protein [Actinomycetes bacterium]
MTSPRMSLNHVAITLPPEEFTADVQKLLIDFYGDVFGWYEYRSGEPGDPLILAFGESRHYLYLLAGDPWLDAPSMDHFGVEVTSVEAIDETLARARKYQERDDRVVVIDKKSEPQRSTIGKVTLTNCYIGYLLPLLVELQHIDVQPFDA